MGNNFDAVLHTDKLVELDKLVAIHVLKREKDIVEGDVEIGLQDPFSDEVQRFQPTRFMDDAIEGAKAIGLFDRFALHSGIGAYSQEHHWFVSEIDQSGVLQGYVVAKSSSIAITLACLKMVGVKVPNEITKVTCEIEF